MKIVRAQKSGGAIVIAVPKEVQIAVNLRRGVSVAVQVVSGKQFMCTVVDVAGIGLIQKKVEAGNVKAS